MLVGESSLVMFHVKSSDLRHSQCFYVSISDYFISQWPDSDADVPIPCVFVAAIHFRDDGVNYPLNRTSRLF